MRSKRPGQCLLKKRLHMDSYLALLLDKKLCKLFSVFLYLEKILLDKPKAGPGIWWTVLSALKMPTHCCISLSTKKRYCEETGEEKEDNF